MTKQVNTENINTDILGVSALLACVVWVKLQRHMPITLADYTSMHSTWAGAASQVVARARTDAGQHVARPGLLLGVRYAHARTPARTRARAQGQWKGLRQTDDATFFCAPIPVADDDFAVCRLFV